MPKQEFEGVTILVVDDESGIRDMLHFVFTELGAEVITAANGEEALDVLKTYQIDAIISDIRMPHMDGQVLLKFIQTHEEMVQPFFFITGFSDLTPQSAEALGASGLFKKPFNISELEAAVGGALKKKK